MTADSSSLDVRLSSVAEAVRRSRGWRRFLLLFFSGAVGALSVPPLFLLPSLFVALPMLVWSLDGAERRPGIRLFFGPAFGIGFAFGLGYFSFALHWLGAAFIQEGGVYLLGMPFAILGLAAILALFWALGAALAHLLWSAGALRIVTLASFLGLAEFTRGHLFSGFPFDLFGYALTGNDELSQLASVVGVYGLTFIAALLAMTPALLWPADARGIVHRVTPLALALVLLAGQWSYGAYRLATTPVVARSDMKARLIQPMITAHADWTLADPSVVIENLVSLSEARLTPNDPSLEGITHLIWPESVFPFFLSQYPDAQQRIAQMLPPNTLLLTGAPREPEGGLTDGGNPGYNAILAIDGMGEIVASYDKSHLVPFGEYLPFRDFWRLFGISQFVPGTNGWAAGTGPRLMQVKGSPPFLALVCYEAVFPGDIGDVSSAEFILNITNDAWFDGSIGPAQHARHARLRAVETGLPMLRASNTGTTLVIDPLGRVTARLAEEEVVLLDAVPAERLPGETLFTRFGHWPFFGAIAAGLLLTLGSGWRQRRRAA